MTLIRRTALAVGLFGTVAAQAQQAPSNALQREERIQELQQLEIDSRIRVNHDVPADERALIDYGGYFTFSYLSLDDANHDNHGLRQYDLVAYGRVLLDNYNEVFIRGRTGYRDFNSGDSFDGLGDEIIDPDLDRAYYKFDLAGYRAGQGEATDTNLVVKAGRDLAYWANGLSLAQTMDGVTVDVKNPAVDLEFLAGVTITRSLDFDPSRPAFDHDTRRGFYGVMASKQIGSHVPFAYALIQRDYNTDHDESTTGAIQTHFDYNSYYLGLGSTGNLSDRLHYGVEAAYEWGNTLSNSFAITNGALAPVTQTRDEINAWGLDARLDYLLQDSHQSRLSAELIMASGDPDRGATNTTFNGNQPGTEDTAFNSFGLLNTGLAFAPAVSNIIALRLGGATFPLGGSDSFRHLQVGTDLFFYAKMRKSAPIDESTLDQKYLGFEPDIYLNWQVASDVTVALRYGAFIPHSAAFPINDDIRQFIYAGVTFAF